MAFIMKLGRSKSAAPTPDCYSRPQKPHCRLFCASVRRGGICLRLRITRDHCRTDEVMPETAARHSAALRSITSRAPSSIICHSLNMPCPPPQSLAAVAAAFSVSTSASPPPLPLPPPVPGPSRRQRHRRSVQPLQQLLSRGTGHARTLSVLHVKLPQLLDHVCNSTGQRKIDANIEVRGERKWGTWSPWRRPAAKQQPVGFDALSGRLSDEAAD